MCGRYSIHICVTLLGWLHGTIPCQRAAWILSGTTIGYSQLTIISNSRSPIRNPGSRWIGVIITTSPPQFDSSRSATDIDEEMWAGYPTETELSTLYPLKVFFAAEQARNYRIGYIYIYIYIYIY